jgi:tetratricopeptide (TPR) repeat protein
MKHIIIIFSLLIISLQAYTQSPQFANIEKKIQDNISQNRWDDVLLLSTDLIIESPETPEGYYYTALSFFNLNDKEKATLYAEKATLLSDSTFMPKIINLKRKINNEQQIESKLSSGDQNSADYWLSIWDIDRSNTNYALNAIEILIEKKQYEKAISILSLPEFANDPDAKNLLTRIKDTPEMQRATAFKNYMELGQNAMAQENYSAAKSLFRKALDNDPNNTKAYLLYKQAEDEEAWLYAKTGNSIADYREYLQANTNQKYAEAAVQTIKNGLAYWGKYNADNNNISQMEYYYFDYLKTYPYGEHVLDIYSTMCATYYRNGKSLSEIKDISSQKTALEYFQNVKSYCPGSYATIDKDIKKSSRRLTRYSRPDRGYYAYAGDSLSPIGFSFGTINNTKLGAYATIGLNSELFTDGAFYTVDNDGKFDGDIATYEKRPTGASTTGSFTAMFGLTKKVFYPFWWYGGVGTVYKVQYIEYQEYLDGSYYGTEWVKNTDETSWNFAAETGIIFDFEGFNVRGGVKTINFSSFIPSFGVGFSIGQ